MKLSNFKIGIKLVIAFILVIAIFVGIIIFMVSKMNNMAQLQDEGAKTRLW